MQPTDPPEKLIMLKKHDEQCDTSQVVLTMSKASGVLKQSPGHGLPANVETSQFRLADMQT